jgi:hypothetical protein
MTAISRKGRTYKLKGVYKHARFSLETVDAENLKSLTYTIKFFYTGDLEDYKLVTNVIFRATKKVINLYLDDVILKKDFISILGQSEYPRSTPTYCDFEFTFYPTRKVTTPIILETLFMNMSKRIHDTIFKELKLTIPKK